MKDEIDNTYTKTEIADIIRKMVTKEFTKQEILFNEISKNPNYEKYLFVKNLFSMSKIDEKPLGIFILNRIKIRGIVKLTFNKMDNMDIMNMGSYTDKIDNKNNDNVENKKDKIEFTI